ncbi:MAG: hypothetical protein AAF790_02220 [Planctomycetota bacterium]
MGYRTENHSCSSCGGMGRTQRTEWTTDLSGNSVCQTVSDPCWTCGGTGRVEKSVYVPDPPRPRAVQKKRVEKKKPQAAGGKKSVAIDLDTLADTGSATPARQPGPPLGSEAWIDACAVSYRSLATLAAAATMLYQAYGSDIEPMSRVIMAGVFAGCVYGLLRGPCNPLPRGLAHATAWALKALAFALKMLALAAGVGFVGFVLLQIIQASEAGR